MEKVFGGCLFAVGVLVAGLSGLCTFMVLWESGGITGPGALESLSIVALVGGVPLVVGAGIAYLGYRLVNSGGER